MNAVLGLDGLIFAGAVSDVVSVVVGGLLALRWYGTINRSEPAMN